MTEPPAQDPSTALQASLQRLTQSRQRLRVTLLPPPGSEGARPDGISRLVPRRLRVWLRRGPLGPVVRTLDPWLGTAQRTLGRWWRRHPFRPAVELAGNTVEQAVVPLIRSHPAGALALGAAAGAALAWAAPWRWGTLQQAARGSGRGLQRWALRQLTGPAAQAVMASVIASLWTSQAQASAREVPRDDAAASGAETEPSTTPL